MRYTEKDLKFEFNNGYDYIRILFSCLFVSPFRLTNEISKKILYINKKVFEKVMLDAVIINTILLCYKLISGLFSGKIYISGSSLPISSLIVSLSILIATYYISCVSKYSLSIFNITLSGINSDNSVPIESVTVSKNEQTAEHIASKVNSTEIVSEVLEHEISSDLELDVESLINEDPLNFSSSMREDEFLLHRESLSEVIETNKYNFNLGDNMLLSPDFIPENMNSDVSEFISQSLFEG